MNPDSMAEDQAREEVSSSSTNLPHMKRIRIPDENVELRDDDVSGYVLITCSAALYPTTKMAIVYH